MSTVSAKEQDSLKSIKYSGADKPLVLLDQRVLPHQVKFDDYDSAEGIHAAIKEMRVRGAPAIAITCALGIAVAATKEKKSFAASAAAAKDWISAKLHYVGSARPTAVNVFNAIAKLDEVLAAAAAAQGATADSTLAAFVAEAERMYEEDVGFNKSMMQHGATFIEKLALQRRGDEAKAASEAGKRFINVVTICNTGALATAAFGTALGVIRQLHYTGKLERVYPLETRPWNQGSRLTVFECVHEQMPTTLIIDNAVAALMQSKKIDAVIVGADRICRNGDTANKIGTCNVAVVAKEFGVPFFVAAPSTTLDPSTASGDRVEIEQRGHEEITHIGGERRIADGPTLSIWNPAFDITPARLITGGIITERGVFPPSKEGTFDVSQYI